MKKLLVGLDIGTNSVGWCACDENGKIVKKNGKRLWGARLFDEASDASGRRGYRTSRRRLQRRRERLSLLRGLFEEEIAKVDDSFFYRLERSFFHSEDRETQFQWTLFNSATFSDKDYYKKYPTIYHLRQELCKSKEKADIRLIYLAIHHIIKYRGNFLIDRQDFNMSDLNGILNSFSNLNKYLSAENSQRGSDDFEELLFDEKIIRELCDFAKEGRTITDTKKKLEEVLMPLNSKNKFSKNIIIPLIAGSSVDVKKKLLGVLDIDDETECDVKSLCTKDENYLDDLSILSQQGIVSDNILECLIECKEIYDFLLLKKLLVEDNQTISGVFVKRYNEHKKQLGGLKKYVKANIPSKYYEIFRKINKAQKSSDTNKLANYPHYIGSNNSNGKVLRFAHSVNKEEFYKFIKQELEIDKFKNANEVENETLRAIYSKIEIGEYLERINSNENGVFPYQLHKIELEQILENQSRFYPFLNGVQGEQSVKDKIVSLLKFRIPYYVGPLYTPTGNKDIDSERSKFAWAVKKSNERVTPWNFDKVVDKNASAMEFIRRMQSYCTYVFGQYCLPKNSLTFCLFNTYNQLNKIKINGNLITPEQKEDLIENLFKKERKVNKKRFKEYLHCKYPNCNIELSGSGKLGFDDGFEINFNLAPFVDFAEIFGKGFENDKKKHELAEDIILRITIFEDKKILQQALRDEYGDKLNDEQIKKLKSLDYKKYATLSKKLLCGFKAEVEEQGELVSKSILDLLKTTNKNFMEIYNDKQYRFDEKVAKYNSIKRQEEFGSKDIKDYVEGLSFISPIIKRPIIQAYKICQEIEKITSHNIDEYYVECTRGEDVKKKNKMTISRKKKLDELYKSIKLGEYDSVKTELGNIEDEQKLRRDKVYLYFTQLGRDIYTGEKIKFGDIEQHYDIDHIVPQSLIKDDSVDNRVLVRKDINNKKQDNYPVDKSILWQGRGGVEAAKRFWKYLKDQKLISSRKFENLIRDELSDEDIEGFVNRQLTTTNQAVKCFIKAITELNQSDGFSPKVVYSKAENVSDYRKLSTLYYDKDNKPAYKGYLGIDKSGKAIYDADILKNRTVNNFHHAHDAYLNIIVGRALDVYFSNLRNMFGSSFYKKAHEDGKTTNVNRVFIQNDYKKKNDIKDKDGNLVYSYDSTLREVQHNIRECFDILVTERCFVKNKLFEKISINPHDGKNNSIPVKEKIDALKNTGRYGGLSGYGFSHFRLLKIEKAKKIIYRIEPIPFRYKNAIYEEKYLREKYSNTQIVLLNKLFINTVVEICETGRTKDIPRFVLTGKHGENFRTRNHNERIFPYEIIKAIRKVEKINNSRKNASNVELGVSDIDNIYKYFVQLLNKPIYSYFSQATNLLKRLNEKADVISALPLIDNFIDKKGKERKQDKVALIMELLNCLKCNEGKSIKLGVIGLGDIERHDFSGKNLKNCRIVFESITGFYRREVFSC